MPIYDFPNIDFYNLHRLLFEMRNSKQLKEEFIKNRENVMSNYSLNETEKKLLRTGDPVAMYKAGVFPYLLHYYWMTIMQASKKGYEGMNLYLQNEAKDE